MKKIVLLLLPDFILSTTVSTESYWLLVEIEMSGKVEIEKIEMESVA